MPPALARQLESNLSRFKRIPSKTRRTTDTNLASGSPGSQVTLRAMARAARDRRATEDDILHGGLGGKESPIRSFSPSDDEEDHNSERLPVTWRSTSGLSASPSVSGGPTSAALSLSFSRRRRATVSGALPGLESIHERISGGPAGTSVGGPDPQGSAGPRTDAEDEEEDVKVSKIRSVHYIWRAVE